MINAGVNNLLQFAILSQYRKDKHYPIKLFKLSNFQIFFYLIAFPKLFTPIITTFQEFIIIACFGLFLKKLIILICI